MSWGGGSTWGTSWLGTWGNSWGPLHEVDEGWDTAQGVARNLARNLSRMAQLDGEAKFGKADISLAVGRFRASGRASASWRGAKVALLSSYKATAGANGFASWSFSHKLKVVFHFSAGGNGFAGFGSSNGVLVGGGKSAGSADGGASFRSVVISTTTKPNFSVQTTHNPSDEEILAIATSLTKKIRRGTYHPVR